MVAFSPDALFPIAAANSRTSYRSEFGVNPVAADAGLSRESEERPVQAPTSQTTSLLIPRLRARTRREEPQASEVFVDFWGQTGGAAAGRMMENTSS